MNARLSHSSHRFTLTACLSFSLLVIGQHTSLAETASQRFTVFVAAKAEVITPPANLVINSIGEAEQKIPTQRWNLATTSTSGMIAEFSVAKPLTHRSLPTVKSDVMLQVRVAGSNGSGRWRTTIDKDATDHDTGDEHASVTVVSSAGGDAAVDLEMEFAGFDELPAGAYGTTVYCTVVTP